MHTEPGQEEGWVYTEGLYGQDLGPRMDSATTPPLFQDLLDRFNYCCISVCCLCTERCQRTRWTVCWSLGGTTYLQSMQWSLSRRASAVQGYLDITRAVTEQVASHFTSRQHAPRVVCRGKLAGSIHAAHLSPGSCGCRKSGCFRSSESYCLSSHAWCMCRELGSGPVVRSLCRQVASFGSLLFSSIFISCSQQEIPRCRVSLLTVASEVM